MRSIITSLVLFAAALVATAQAGPQLNPLNQIQGSLGCTLGTQVWDQSSKTCVNLSGGVASSSVATNYGLTSKGGVGFIHFSDSTGPGSLLNGTGAPSNSTCTGSNLGVSYIRTDVTPYQFYNCDQTLSIWLPGTPYASTTGLLFDNFNQKSPWSNFNSVYTYPGTPYTNSGAPLNTGNATTADVADIEVYPNYNPPDFGAPVVYTSTGAADVFNCNGGTWGASYSNCDLSVRGSLIAMLSWLGSPLHGKMIARNQTKGGSGTWTDTDPTSQTTTATWSAGATTITVASATGVAYGQHVVDTTNPSSMTVPSVVIGVSGTTVTLNNPLPAASSGDSVTFWNTGSSPFTPGVMTCGTTGATLTFSTMPASGALYMNWLVVTGGTDTATMTIDGGAGITLSSGVLGTWNTQKTTTMWYGQRYALTGSGAHTVVLTVTAGSFCPLFAVTPTPNGWQGLTTPDVFSWVAPPPTGGYSGNASTVQNAQTQVMQQFKVDGFHVNLVDPFKETWPEGSGSSLYCEYNYPCTYPGINLSANVAAGPHFNKLGDSFNAQAFLRDSARTTTQVSDVNGIGQVQGISGVPFCSGFAPTVGQNIQYSTSGTPNPCWAAASPSSSGMTYQGVWSGSAAYVVGSVVSYNGVGYLTVNAVSAPAAPVFIQGASSASTYSVSTTSNVTAGDVLYSVESCRGFGTDPCDLNSALVPTDTQGNTWHKLASYPSNTLSPANASYGLYLYSTTVGTTGPITVTNPTISNNGSILINNLLEFSHMTETYNNSVKLYSTSSTSFTVNPFITISGNVMLLSILREDLGSTLTPVGGIVTGTNSTNAGFGIMATGYEEVASGTFSPGFTVGNSSTDNATFMTAAINVAGLNTTPDQDSTHWLSFDSSIKSVPFCTGFTPTNGQTLQYTTGGSPNPCWAAVSGNSVNVNGSSVSNPNINDTTPSVVGATGVNNKWQVSGSSVSSYTPVATGSVPGVVKPDGTTCTVSSGTLTCTGSAGATSIPICTPASASGTAYTCTTSPTFTPVSGSVIAFKPDVSNSGTSATLNVNASSAAPLAKWQTTTTLAANDFRANSYTVLTYDGTNWEAQTIGNAPSGGGGSSFPYTVYQSPYFAPAGGTSWTWTLPQALQASGATAMFIMGMDANGGASAGPSGSTCTVNVSSGTNYARLMVCLLASAGQTSVTFSTTGSAAPSIRLIELSGTRTFDVTSSTSFVSGSPTGVSLASFTPTSGSAVFEACTWVTNSVFPAAGIPIGVPGWQDLTVWNVNSSSGRYLSAMSYIPSASGSALQPPMIQIPIAQLAGSGTSCAAWSIK